MKKKTKNFFLDKFEEIHNDQIINLFWFKSISSKKINIKYSKTSYPSYPICINTIFYKGLDWVRYLK